MERRASPPGGRASRPSPHGPKLLRRHRFLIDQDLQMRGHVFVQFDRHNELAIVLSGSCSWIFRRSMWKLFFSSASAISPAVTDRTTDRLRPTCAELHFEPLKLLGQRFGFRLSLAERRTGRGLHLLDDSLVGSVA